MNRKANNGVVWAEADLRSKSGRVAFARRNGRSQNHPVRFWIITMMLVLIGLSTLKLR
jgi:UDP-N-acetylmuramyl pentapeptide phosphotransferase/UDP-N-acetylglucosamine-1-phosphate transferase